jgi:hypothetical protein
LFGAYGIYKYNGFAGTGFYEPDPNDVWDGSWRFGTGSYYGISGYGTPIAPPTGMQWYTTGWGGAGYYSTGLPGDYWWNSSGTGVYYGSSGNSPGLDPT